MNIKFESLPVATLVVVMASWFVFAAAILIKRTRVVEAADAKRDRASDYGLVLQVLAYAIVWFFPRQMVTSIAPQSRTLTLLFSILAMAVALGSVLIIISAINILGREWSVKARLIEGHTLVVSGPYHWVRHPIYTGMLGMLLATGLAMSQWPALIVGIAILLIGTFIRINSEERLLRGEFGSEFDNYSRRVSAILPGII